MNENFHIPSFERSLMRKPKKNKHIILWIIFAVIIILAAIDEFAIWKPVFLPTANAEVTVPDDNGFYCTQLMKGEYVADAQTFKHCEKLIAE